jgi:MoaA/NifB/PqqE/SkfB family radical SAM enzyme
MTDIELEKQKSDNKISFHNVNERLQIPYAVLCELTHRCPLSCPYCSNPVELEKKV